MSLLAPLWVVSHVELVSVVALVARACWLLPAYLIACLLVAFCSARRQDVLARLKPPSACGVPPGTSLFSYAALLQNRWGNDG